MSDSSAYKQPEAGFPGPGPLGQPSKPAVVIADRAPLGWPTHLAVCLPLLPGCLSYLRVLSFSLCWGFEPTIQSQLGLHVANLSKRGWQRIHLSPVGLGIQQPGFVPGALYGSLGVSLVSQQSCMTEESITVWCMHASANEMSPLMESSALSVSLLGSGKGVNCLHTLPAG